MLSGMHYKFFDRQMSSRFSLHVTFEWEIVLFILWYEWQHRNDFCLSDSDKYPSVLRSGRPFALPVFWAANISDVVQVMLLLPVSQRKAGRAALTEPVNQSYSLANKD